MLTSWLFTLAVFELHVLYYMVVVWTFAVQAHVFVWMWKGKINAKNDLQLSVAANNFVVCLLSIGSILFLMKNDFVTKTYTPSLPKFFAVTVGAWNILAQGPICEHIIHTQLKKNIWLRHKKFSHTQRIFLGLNTILNMSVCICMLRENFLS